MIVSTIGMVFVLDNILVSLISAETVIDKQVIEERVLRWLRGFGGGFVCDKGSQVVWGQEDQLLGTNVASDRRAVLF